MRAAARAVEKLRRTQHQGCFVLAGVSAGWFWAADRRSAALATARAASAARKPTHERPHVTAVLPVRGCTPTKLRNWASQTSSDYGGRLDVLFVVESADDPAVRHRAALRLPAAAADADARGAVCRSGSAMQLTAYALRALHCNSGRRSFGHEPEDTQPAGGRCSGSTRDALLFILGRRCVSLPVHCGAFGLRFGS